MPAESMIRADLFDSLRAIGPYTIRHDTPGLKDETGALLFVPTVGDVLFDAWMEVEESLLADGEQGPVLQLGTWADAGDRLFTSLFDPQGAPGAGTDILRGTATGCRILTGNASIDGLTPPRFLTASPMRVRLSDDADGDGDAGYDPITDAVDTGIVHLYFLVCTPRTP